MSFKLIIFDLDLTLIDTCEQVCSCFTFAFEQAGIKLPSKESMCKQIGTDLSVTFKNLSYELGVDLNEEQIKELRELFVQHAREKKVIDSIKIYDDTLPLLNFLIQENMQLGLLTSKPRWLVNQLLEKFNLKAFFKEDNIIAEDEVTNKPAPDGIFKLAKNAQVNNDAILYIGDGVVDAQTAQAADVAFLGVLTGVTKKEELQEYFNIVLLNNLMEAKNFIEENRALGPM